MKCYNHPDKEANRVCKTCQHAFCSDCFLDEEDHICRNCVVSFSSIKVRNLVNENKKHQMYGYHLFLAMLAGLIVGIIVYQELRMYVELANFNAVYGTYFLLFCVMLAGVYITTSFYAGIEWTNEISFFSYHRNGITNLLKTILKWATALTMGIIIVIPYSVHRWLSYTSNKQQIFSKVHTSSM